MELPKKIINFFKQQEFVLVSTLDKKGRIHNAVKGIVEIEEKNQIYIVDLYKLTTFNNLKKNKIISITAVDGKNFIGYCLKGTAKIIDSNKIETGILETWQKKILKRISTRLIRNLKAENISRHHPEVKLPKPAYFVALLLEEIVDLTPEDLKVKLEDR